MWATLRRGSRSSALGHEVWALPTVLLSSHAGYAKVGGESLSADLLKRLIDGLDANGWLGRCDAVLSGYLGHADHASVVADAVRRVKAANRNAFYCLDPVFGDAGRAYAKPGVAEAMARELLPLADIVTPNVFELSSLTSVAIRNADDALVAAKRLGRPVVVVNVRARSGWTHRHAGRLQRRSVARFDATSGKSAARFGRSYGGVISRPSSGESVTARCAHSNGGIRVRHPREERRRRVRTKCCLSNIRMRSLHRRKTRHCA